MSGHTRNLTQKPTRTVAGSYEAPVEGIVDYGAFQRGFDSTFKMPKKKEEEEDKSTTVKIPEVEIERAQGVDFNIPQSGINLVNNKTAEQLRILGKKYTVNENDPNAQSKIQEGQRVVSHYVEGGKGATIMLQELAKNFSMSNYNRLGQPIESTTVSGAKVNLHPIQIQEAFNSGRVNPGIGQDSMGNEVGGIFIKIPGVKQQYKATNEELEEIKKQGLTLDPFKVGITGQIPSSVSQEFAESQQGLTSSVQQALVGSKNLKANLQSSLVFVPTENFKDADDFNLKYSPPKADIETNLSSALSEIQSLKLNLSADGDFFEDDKSISYLNTNTNKVVTNDTDSKILNDKGYAQVDFKAAAAAREILGQVKYADNKNAVVLDAVFGEGDNKIVEGSPLSNRLLAKYGEKKEIKNKEGQVVRVEYNNPKITLGGVEYDLNLLNKANKDGIIGGDLPQSVRSFIAKEYVEDKYKILYGTDGYHDDGNGVAVKTYAKDVDKKLTVRPDKEQQEISRDVDTIISNMNLIADRPGGLDFANFLGGKQFKNIDGVVNNLNTVVSPGGDARFMKTNQFKDAFYFQYQDSNGEYNQNNVSSKAEVDKLWQNKLMSAKGVTRDGRETKPLIWDIKNGATLANPIDYTGDVLNVFSLIVDSYGIEGMTAAKLQEEFNKRRTSKPIVNNDYNK